MADFTPLFRGALELGFAAFALIGGGYLLRHYTTRVGDDGRPKGIGLRAIQMTVAVLTAPVVLILALEGKLSQEGTGILLGTLIGFILSPKG
jgi:hypothetical protein